MNRRQARGKANRWVVGCLVAVSALFVGAAPASADRPVQEGPFLDVFDDVNPCTGLIHTVTISTTFSVHSHDGTEVVTGESEISTSSGFSGQGRSSFVGTGKIERAHFLDMLSNDAGDRIQARGCSCSTPRPKR